MIRTIGHGLFLFVIWLLLSGHFDFLLLGLGVISVGLTLYLIKRMKIDDHESFPFHLFSMLPSFLVYILREILKSNIEVLKRIMTWNSLSICPQLIDVPLPQKTDMGRVIYANSITLTPGTVCVDLTKEKVIVHALTTEASNDLSTGDMAKAIPDRDTSE